MANQQDPQAGPVALVTGANRGLGKEQGARVIVQLATLPDDGPTGGFFNDQGPVPW